MLYFISNANITDANFPIVVELCEGNPTVGHPIREINSVLRDSQTAVCADV